MAQKTTGWHPENVKAEIRKRHGTLGAFAKKVGVSLQSVSEAIATPNGSSRVESLIAEDLGMPLHEIWPDRWTVNDQKIDRAEFRRARHAARIAA